ncbi:TetR/AcrR family transcriptional regulator [Sphingorhabdus pulchriflava]|uniref:TetR/AcrR family transcriptional regulator n=1 Tax=Sphingorhabdus pulchriflava TaxID=2292257 RepID=A0A371BG34_9SPHN|nr:TetR/AcrR family transcriptional regulator [Sphingorhabdus pulchriflava]RDV06321.1 TetR/AcrR family transcriptional regulator [Sphingorhabdus pulchriflava]
MDMKTQSVSNTRTQKTVARILGAARDCFSHLGIEKTTIVDIAEAAQFSRPVIYKYFTDKDDIVDRVCLEEMQALQLQLNARVPRDVPFVDQLAEAILQAVLLARGNIYIQRFMDDRQAWVRSQSEGGAVHIWVRDRWRSFLLRGQREGIVADDLDIEQCVTWIALVQSLLLLRYSNEYPDETDMRRFVRRFVVTPMLIPAG